MPEHFFICRKIQNKVTFFHQCSKMQIIPIKKFNNFFGFSDRNVDIYKGQIIFKIHLSLPNAYKLMCFDRNMNGNRDVKFLECDKWSLHLQKNLTLPVLFFVTPSLLQFYEQKSDYASVFFTQRNNQLEFEMTKLKQRIGSDFGFHF